VHIVLVGTVLALVPNKAAVKATVPVRVRPAAVPTPRAGDPVSAGD
jgi:hypothetical protein